MAWLTRFVSFASVQPQRSVAQIGVRNKLLAILLAAILAACQPASSAEDIEHHDKVVYCVHKYTVGDDITRIPVCSQYPLSPKQVQFLDDQFEYSCYLYRKFVKSKGFQIPNETEFELDIYLTTYEHINDPVYFPRNDENKQIVGRYVNGVADLYLTDRIFERQGYTDFPHELAHWMNNVIGVTDKGKNEKLAQDFERYYEINTR